MKVIWPPPNAVHRALRKECTAAFVAGDMERWERATREMRAWLKATGNESLGMGGSTLAAERLQAYWKERRCAQTK